MLNNSLNLIKQELKHLSYDDLFSVCVRLMKYKKENKELADYLLFEQNNLTFQQEVNQEIIKLFEGINISSMFLAKKTIRKTLRICNKYIKFSDNPIICINTLICFCEQMNFLKIDYKQSVSMKNLYFAQIKSIQNNLSRLHEDIQYDYKEKIEELMKAGGN